jgi:hypothetical protein
LTTRLAMTTTTPKPKTARRKQKTIARNIELYNSAFRAAWKRISASHKSELPNIYLRIHSSIRRQLKEGATDANLIVSEVLSDFAKLYRRKETG